MSRSNRNRNKKIKNKNRNIKNDNSSDSGVRYESRSDDSGVEVGDVSSKGSQEEIKDFDNSKIKQEEISKQDTKISDSIKVFFLNDVNEYIDHFETILSLSREYLRVNVVIKSVEEPKTQKLPSNIHIYTGEVWYNIHKAREVEGFYSA